MHFARTKRQPNGQWRCVPACGRKGKSTKDVLKVDCPQCKPQAVAYASLMLFDPNELSWDEYINEMKYGAAG